MALKSAKLWVRVAVPLLATALLASCSPSAETLQFTAYDVCKGFAADQLRDPESTDWPTKPTSITGPDATGTYLISVATTSNNGFGGKTRVSVSCTVLNNPAGSDNWKGKASVV